MNKKDKDTKFKFLDISPPVSFEDGSGKKKGIIKGIGQTVDQLNKNHRIYPREVVEAAIEEAIGLMEGGQLFYLTGESDHPSDKGFWSPQFLETIINWTEIKLNGSYVEIEGKLIETSKGQDAKIIMESGILPGISLRGWGDSYWIWPEEDDEEGIPIQMVTELHYDGFDLVLKPADHQGAVKVLESHHAKDKSLTEGDESEQEESLEETEEPKNVNIKPNLEKEEFKMNKDVLRFIELVIAQLDLSDSVKAQIMERVVAQEPEDADAAKIMIDSEVSSMMAIVSDLSSKVEASKKEAAATVNGLLEATGASTPDEAARIIAAQKSENEALKAQQTALEVAKFTDAEFKKLTWSTEIVEGFKDAVAQQNPTTVEEATTVIAKMKPSFDKLASKVAMASQGYGNYQVADVLEEETGYASYAKVSYRLAESLSNRGLATIRDFRKPQTGAERFAAAYLKMYDAEYQSQLMAEAQQFSDTLVSTDLNLPYSVMRAIIAEVFPILTAASVYDFGVGSGSTTKIYYEVHAGESGMTGSVTDEATGLPAFAAENGITQTAWVSLANGRVLTGTVVVTDQAATAILDDGTNFVIDHEQGAIKLMQGGSSTAVVAAATDFLVDYDYYVWRGLENAEIQEAKTVLENLDLAMKPDRLSIDITKESIVWSQQDLAYDVVARNLSNVIQQLRTKIDHDIHFKALNSLLTVQNNIVGTWTIASDTPEDLANLIGRAKVAVANRHYNASRVVMSVSNADYLSNADAFNAAGDRNDSSLATDGHIGRTKGLPVTETANFTDSYIKVVASGLLAHRVSRGMEIEGPLPKYGANLKPIANDLYYVEEFNGSVVPVPTKGAVIKVA